MTDNEDNHRAWDEVLDRKRELTWELWASDVTTSTVLTPAGRRTVLWAVNEISEFLGPNWLEHHRAHLRPELPELPMMSMRWWPGNDASHVHLRLLDFALKLRLLREAQVPGLGPVRRNTRKDLGHFAHSCVQLEVAALAQQAGWTVRLEPPPHEVAGRRTDLLLTNKTHAMAVEVKTLVTDQLMRNDVSISHLIQPRLLAVSSRHQVEFAGHIYQPDSPEERTTLLAWLEDLDQAAAHVRASGLPSRPITPPTGGHVVIVPDDYAHASGLTIPIRTTDPLTRLFGKIADKVEQGKGTGIPMWLRINETWEFYQQLIPNNEPDRSRGRDNLIRALERNLALYPHVAGMILSSEPISYSTDTIDATVRLPSAAVAVARTTQPPWYRSTLIVRGPLRSAKTNEQVATWINWYRAEGTYLTWALNRAGLPPLREITANTAGPPADPATT